jgi:uncharacterized membrane protein
MYDTTTATLCYEELSLRQINDYFTMKKLVASMLGIATSPFFLAQTASSTTSNVAESINLEPLIKEDTIVFGIFTMILAIIFYTSAKSSFKKFYTFVPALLLCYMIPALLNTFGIISKDVSGLYGVAKNYLLPASLLLMTLCIDFKGLKRIGSKAVIMFLTGTIGIIIGGPIALWIVASITPESFVFGEAPEATWRGLSTISGSWIGGGPNQNAMLETYQYPKSLFTQMVIVDIVVANIWMAVLLFGAGMTQKIDKWLKADSSAVDALKENVKNYQSSIARTASTTDFMVLMGITFGGVALSHFAGLWLSGVFSPILGENAPLSSKFFWLVVISTTIGLLLSLTKARNYEGVGASKFGSVFIYLLVATIGMQMNLYEITKVPVILVVGGIWMIIHVLLMLIVAKIVRAPFFFVAIGSQANVGGAASAPVVASAFDPALASVGAILAVFGYAVGTYGAIACAEMMSWVNF